MDIGTTSVVIVLIDLSTGVIMARHSFMNPQRTYGPDVISRIDAANNGHLDELRNLITQAIAGGMEKLLSSCNVPSERVIETVIAGNTTMTYLLLGFPCKSLGVLPFKPAIGLREKYTMSDVFGNSAINCPVHIVPWFAAFVGGDITAGLLNVILEGRGKFMLIDLGTNGEIALYYDDKLIVTSTAAGPAFESSTHRGGASMILDELAQLVQNGFVDETGFLSDNAPVVFTQKEIRDLQLAKSAVRSGLEILLESAGIDYGSLDAVYLAGGIGQAMNVNSAIVVGLLPEMLKDKVIAVGNASLGGAARILLDPKNSAKDMKRLQITALEINLAGHPRFNEYFMEYMLFSG
ncbi:MAG: ASKHA domain-containing protein [Oscillospiraceae bacterium]|nr:ASKHA domain-containing protein [Oscillospiraceae bacterium]